MFDIGVYRRMMDIQSGLLMWEGGGPNIPLDIRKLIVEMAEGKHPVIREFYLGRDSTTEGNESRHGHYHGLSTDGVRNRHWTWHSLLRNRIFVVDRTVIITLGGVVIRDIIKEVRSIPTGDTSLLVRAGWDAAIRAIEQRVNTKEAEQLKRLMDDTASDDGDYGASITE